MLHKIQSFFHSSIHQLKIYLILLALPCLALQCDPDNNNGKDPKPTYYMSEEFKDYVFFPEGSWWFYENQYGQKDSVYLFWKKTKIVKNSKTVEYNYEMFKQHLTSSFYDSLFGSGGAELAGTKQPSTYFEGSLENETNVFPQFFTGKDVDYVLPLNNNLKYTQFQDSLKIFDNTFFYVKKFEIIDQEGQQQPKFIWYAKNVGVIKKEMFDSTIWKLKDYHINH